MDQTYPLSAAQLLCVGRRLSFPVISCKTIRAPPQRPGGDRSQENPPPWLRQRHTRRSFPSDGGPFPCCPPGLDCVRYLGTYHVDRSIQDGPRKDGAGSCEQGRSARQAAPFATCGKIRATGAAARTDAGRFAVHQPNSACVWAVSSWAAQLAASIRFAPLLFLLPPAARTPHLFQPDDRAAPTVRGHAL
jgi:hypothetical protein